MTVCSRLVHVTAHIPGTGEPQLLFAAGNFFHSHRTGVHGAEHISGFQENIPFVMDEAGSVDSQGRCFHRDKILSVTGLVAQRPTDNAGMIFIPLHHPDHAIHDRICPGRIAARDF